MLALAKTSPRPTCAIQRAPRAEISRPATWRSLGSASFSTKSMALDLQQLKEQFRSVGRIFGRSDRSPDFALVALQAQLHTIRHTPRNLHTSRIVTKSLPRHGTAFSLSPAALKAALRPFVSTPLRTQRRMFHRSLQPQSNVPTPAPGVLDYYKPALQGFLLEKRYNEIFLVYDDMLEAGVVPDTEVCNIVAETFLIQHQPSNIHELMHSFMSINNIPFDGQSYLLLIQAHDALGLFPLVRRDYDLLQASAATVPLRTEHINTVVSSALKHRAYDFAREVLADAAKLNLKNEATTALEQALDEREGQAISMGGGNITSETSASSNTTNNASS